MTESDDPLTIALVLGGTAIVANQNKPKRSSGGGDIIGSKRDKGVQFATEEDFQADRKARRRRRLSITRGLDGSIPNPLAIN